MKRVVLVVLPLLALTACGSKDEAATLSTPSSASSSSASSSPSPKPSPSSTRSAPAPAPLPLPKRTPAPTPTTKNGVFGQTFTYDDGLAITVSPGKAFQPGRYAATDNKAAYLAFTITIVNGTSSNYDPGLFTASVQSGSTEGSRVFDSENNITSAPRTALLPGRTSTFPLGFGVDDPADVVMQVSPGTDYDDTIFTTGGAGGGKPSGGAVPSGGSTA